VTDAVRNGKDAPGRIRVSRSIPLPNPVAVARYRRLPELGPRILFFSGGTALRHLSRELVAYTHNSIHLITPFDSGGSSAVLRQAFHMPAVGDIRNRLMALADRGFTGNPHIIELFAYRFSKNETHERLRSAYADMADGQHPLVAAIPDPMRKIIRQHLYEFQQRMPADFDLRGANIGNLILAGGYLNNRRHFDPVIYIFSRLVNVLGLVRPIINKDLHLAVELEGGRRIVGQHRITGKETAPLERPIQRMVLNESVDEWRPAAASVRGRVRELIQSADLICYPMGSFYSSVLANLLPAGVGRTIAATDCPKIYIPNSSADPESVGIGVMEQIEKLLACLQADAPEAAAQDLLQFVLLDRIQGHYRGQVDEDRLKKWGITLIDTDLVDPAKPPHLEPNKLTPVLLSLA
jgi:CofD-related protein of GAK system